MSEAVPLAPVVTPGGRFAMDRVLLRLAIPIAFGFVTETLFGMLDTFLVGRVGGLGPAAITATGFGRSAMSPLILALGALLYGAQAIAGRRVGAGQPLAAGLAGREALRVALAAGVPVLVCAGLALGPLCAATLRDPGVEVAAHDFLAIRLLGLPLIAATMAVRGFLYGIGRPGADLVTSAAALVLNAVFGAWLVNGGFGVPALGVRGVALATLAAEALQTVLLAAWVGYAPALRAFGLRGCGGDRAVRWTVVRVSLPRAIQGLSLVAFPAFIAVIEKVGVLEGAAAAVVFSAHSAFFFLGYGVGVGGGTLAAQALGAGDPARARAAAMATIRVAGGLTATVGVVAACVAVPWLAVFTDDPRVQAAALGPYLAYACALPFDAVGAALARVLMATGSGVYVMAIEIVTALGLFIPLAWWLALPAGGGAWGAWGAFGIYILAFGGSMAVRIAGRTWTGMAV